MPNDPPAAAHAHPPLVEFIDVSKSFGRQPVLHDISFTVNRGQSTVVIGPSGCGKSVLLKHVIGLIRPDAGEVRFDGARIDGLAERRLAPVRRRIGFLFQQGALFDSMTVGENVAFPLVEHTDLDRRERDRRVKEALELVGLPDVAAKMTTELSGGQQKRVALARAIVLRPELILYDEPTTGLDPIRADLIVELIMKLHRTLKIASIVVTHDMKAALAVAEEMFMLHEGRIILRGRPEEFEQASDPVIRRFLDGEATDEELAAIRGDDPAPARRTRTREGAA